MEKKYYVYLHKRKNTNKVFYVGKGTKSVRGVERVECTKNRNIWWHHIVDKDGGFDYEIYADNLKENEAFELEKTLIEQIGISNLVNLTDGGNGGDTLSKHPNIEEIGKKISEHHKGENNPNYGKGYYYWWVKKYGKEKADEMKSKMVSKIATKLKGRSNGSEKWLSGENNPAKSLESRKKISNFAKNRIRKIIKCEKCGLEVSDTHIKRHQNGKNCKNV